MSKFKISSSAIPSLEAESKVLENGMKLFVLERPNLPIASVQLWVKTGSIHEGEFLGSGLSHFLEHMVFNGSKNYPKNKIAEIAAENGGRINAGTSFGYTMYYIDILSESVSIALDIIADAVMFPLFPEDCFANEKDVILRERAMYSDNPHYFASEKVLLTMFAEHPMRHPIIGYKEKIEAVSRSMMVEYFEKRYSPQRSFLVVCGNIKAAEIFKIAEEKFSAWRMGCIYEDGIPFEPPQNAQRTANFAFKDPLHRLEIAFHIPYASSPDFPALDLLSMALGANRSSRLPTKLERAEKLAISANAYAFCSYFCGIFNVSAVCDTANSAKLKQRIIEEIEDLPSSEPISNEEIRRCEMTMISDYLKHMRISHSIASIAANSIINYGNPNYSKIFFEKIAALSKKDLQKVAEKYFSPGNCTIVEVMPEETFSASTTVSQNLFAKPQPELTKLDNGVRIIAAPDNSLSLVDISIVLPGGNLIESDDFAGSSTLVAELLDAGTEKMHEEDIAVLLDENAIEFSASSNANLISISMTCHSSVLDTALDILFEILATPTFPDEQFEREKENLLNEIRSRKLSPRVAAENLLRKTLFGNHPYARPLPADEENIAKLTSATLKQFYSSKCLCAEKAVIGISGDFKKEKLLKKIARFAENLPWEKYSMEFPLMPDFPKSPVLSTEKIPREQSVVILGVPICDLASPDMPALKFLAKGCEGMNSRIFKKIRCESGLAYYTGMSLFSGFHPGYAALYVGTHSDASEHALNLLDEIRKDIMQVGMDESEFKSARAGLERDIAEIRANSSSLIGNSAIYEYFGLGFDHLNRLEKEYLEMNNQRIISTVKKYFDTESIVRIIAGP